MYFPGLLYIADLLPSGCTMLDLITLVSAVGLQQVPEFGGIWCWEGTFLIEVGVGGSNGSNGIENGMNNLSRLQVGLMDTNITWQISTCLDVAESRLKFV